MMLHGNKIKLIKMLAKDADGEIPDDGLEKSILSSMFQAQLLQIMQLVSK